MARGVTRSGLEQLRPTWAEIDLDALVENLAAVRKQVGSSGILAVVKANAYGHGAVPVARALERHGVAAFGVALPEEGVELRRAGLRSPILLLGGCTPEQAGLVLEHDLEPAVYRLDQLQALSAAASSRECKARVHLKIDTGMSRLGIDIADVPSFAAALVALPRLEVAGIFSHLAVAEVPGDRFTDRQLALFRGALEALASAGIRPPSVHLANSAAMLDHPPTWLTVVRPGLALYGYSPGPREPSIPLRPALSLHSRVIFLRELLPGATVGYGRTFRASGPVRIATLAIGYGDGLPAQLGNCGHVLLRGCRAPIVGRVNMDLTTIDVTRIPPAAIGDRVVLCGAQGSLRLGADRIAADAGTHVWDVLCGIGPRVPRVYRENGVDTLFSPGNPPLV